MPPRRNKMDRDAKRNLVPTPPPPKRKIPGRNINPETGERMPGYKPSPKPIAPKPIDDTFNVTPDPSYDLDAYGELAAFLQTIGLGSLLQIDKNGNPSGWLYEQMIEGVDTEAELVIALQSTPEFQARFPVIVEQQQAAAANGVGQVMTPRDVLYYEETVRDAMVRAGMPEGFYDQPDDFFDLIRSGESAQSVANKIERAYDFVNSAPEPVRKAFSEFYGVSGDAAMAAYILDPERTLSTIERAQRTAFVGGMGRSFNVEMSRDASELIADTELSQAAIEEGFREISSQQNVFAETFGERDDLTAEETGVAATFGGDAGATTALERRLIQRQSIARTSTGGALVTREGVVGL